MRKTIALLAVLGCLAGAAPAGAAAGLGDKVAQGPTGVELRARDEGDRLCLRLDAEGAESQTCGAAPAEAPQPVLLTLDPPDDQRVVAGAVTADVATVEIETAAGRIQVATVAGEEYRGRAAGRVRFFIASIPARERLVRLHDAGGVLVGAADTDLDGHPEGAPVRLFRARGLSIDARIVRELAPTPLELDRFGRSLCIRARSRGDHSETCLDEAPFRLPLNLHIDEACAPRRAPLYGFVDPRTERLELLLGSGRRVSTPARALPFDFAPAMRAVAMAIPRGEAVRRARALDAEGDVIAAEAVGAAPGGLPCRGRDRTGFHSIDGFPSALFEEPAPAPDQGAQAVAESSGRRLLVRDDGEHLCAGIDRLAADGRDCTLPPVDVTGANALRDGRLIAALLPATAARVRVRLDRGRTLDLATTDGPAYTGRYAGRLRFLLAELPADREPHRATVIDASGHALGRLFLPPRVPRLSARRTVLRTANARLFTRRVIGQGESCLGVAIGGETVGEGPFGECILPAGRFAGFQAIVTCRPRVALMFGVLARGLRGVRVRLAGGRVLRVRRDGRFWAVEIPRRARVTRVVFSGRPPAIARGLPRPPSRRAFTLLPAARQCGYGDGDPMFG